MRAFLLLITCLLVAPADASVVFMYHRFGESDYPSTNIRMEQFEAELEFLDREGFEVWPLPKLVEHLRTHEPLPDKVVALTIDDAYASVYQEAFPLLQERKLPFTVFVSTNVVDRALPDYMSWEQLRELQRSGIATLANHGASHAYLARKAAGESEQAWAARIREDIVKGQARLQEMLGNDVNESPRLFAYPYGEYTLQLMQMLKQMGYVAFGQHSGPAGPHDDLQALPRFPVNEHFGDLEDFSLKALTLPFPVLEVSPQDPTVEAAPPLLELRFGESSARLSRLSCYLGGERIEVAWVSREERRVQVKSANPLPEGRSRYNCTAPHVSAGRWYWYSHPWLRTRN